MQRILFVILLSAASCAQTAKPCLAVYPSEPGNAAAGIALAPITLGASALMIHGQRFSYLESAALPIKEVKVMYSKRELEKLEKRGVTIIVTAQSAVAAKENHSDQADGNSSSSGQTTMSVQGTAGCLK
jgi:hypothetical protein